ncbi:MAG: hypothetical protein P8168_00415, partial [Deltaproteobacteria bacterium]
PYFAWLHLAAAIISWRVWIERQNGFWQVVSSINGTVTIDPADHLMPRLNNLGSIVWSQKVGKFYQVFKAVPLF